MNFDVTYFAAFLFETLITASNSFPTVYLNSLILSGNFSVFAEVVVFGLSELAHASCDSPTKSSEESDYMSAAENETAASLETGASGKDLVAECEGLSHAVRSVWVCAIKSLLHHYCKSFVASTRLTFDDADENGMVDDRGRERKILTA